MVAGQVCTNYPPGHRIPSILELPPRKDHFR